uniref:Uncharacterized protein n=1 Tax=Triticum urartu TaxID=4572 RepID=A0A8R7P6W4_TRIUA
MTMSTVTHDKKSIQAMSLHPKDLVPTSSFSYYVHCWKPGTFKKI